MKIKFLIFFLTTLVCSAFAQESANGRMDAVILQQANIMGKAFVAKDYAGFAKFTHPTVTALMGGEERMIGEMEKAFGALENEGVTFLAVNFGEPSKIIIVENELQCTLPQMIDMKVIGGKMTVHATLIAVSQDQGKSWYFIDVSDTTLANMRKVIPSLSPNLEIPDEHEPVYIADDETKLQPGG